MTEAPRRPRLSDTLGTIATDWVTHAHVPSYTLGQIRADLQATLEHRGDGPAIHDFQRACIDRLPWHGRLSSPWQDHLFPGVYAYLRTRVLGAQLGYVDLPLSAAIANLDAVIADVERQEEAD